VSAQLKALAAAAVACAMLVLAQAAAGDHSVKELLSTGPAGGNGAYPANYAAASRDGTRVFFETSEQLVSADTDVRIDVYERAGGTTTLVSTGPAGGNGGFDASLAGASDDGSHVFLATKERLTSADTDSQFDVYDRSGGTTTLVSTGPAGGNGATGAFFDGASANGDRVFLHTREALVSGDTDASIDVYERAAATTTRVSGGNGAFDAFFTGVSSDGVHVFYETSEPVAAGDTDSSQDVYDRATLVSAPGNGAFDAFFDGSSDDGSRAFFSTDEPLAAGDTDSQFDVYERAGGTTTKVSSGNGASDVLFTGASADGSHVFYETDEPIAAGDTDTSRDVYDRGTLVSAGGNGTFDAVFDGTSDDGLHVFFQTDEQLTGTDTDSATDVYERIGGVTMLVSTGSAELDALFEGISSDGARAFFATDEPLVAGDSDLQRDVYERAGGATTLLSTGPAGGNGAFPADFTGTSDDGSRVFFETSEPLVAADTDTSLDLYSAGIDAGYARPRGATPFRVSLVPAYGACSAPNSQHGAPLAFGSCKPPVQASSTLTVGTPDANGGLPQSIGSMRLDVLAGDPDTAADEADVAAVISISDVRRRSDLSDYTGQLRALLDARITDRSNGSSRTDSATGTDTAIPVTVPCAATADTGVGATCATATTIDALLPGAVVEGKRAIWQLGGVTVEDGGADGVASTTPNTPFARQGVFIP
jgi:hypothetical protein